MNHFTDSFPVIKVSLYMSLLIQKRLIDIFNDPGDPLSATYTGADHSVFLIQSFQVIQVLNGEFTTGTTQGMAQGKSPYVDIDFSRVQSCFTHSRDGL